MTNLWKVTVNNWGWDRPMTYHFRTRKEAQEASNRYPASDGVEYAGNFTDMNAKRLLGEDRDED